MNLTKGPEELLTELKVNILKKIQGSTGVDTLSKNQKEFMAHLNNMITVNIKDGTNYTDEKLLGDLNTLFAKYKNDVINVDAKQEILLGNLRGYLNKYINTSSALKEDLLSDIEAFVSSHLKGGSGVGDASVDNLLASVKGRIANSGSGADKGVTTDAIKKPASQDGGDSQEVLLNKIRAFVNAFIVIKGISDDKSETLKKIVDDFVLGIYNQVGFDKLDYDFRIAIQNYMQKFIVGSDVEMDTTPEILQFVNQYILSFWTLVAGEKIPTGAPDEMITIYTTFILKFLKVKDLGFQDVANIVESLKGQILGYSHNIVDNDPFMAYVFEYMEGQVGALIESRGKQTDKPNAEGGDLPWNVNYNGNEIQDKINGNASDVQSQDINEKELLGNSGGAVLRANNGPNDTDLVSGNNPFDIANWIIRMNSYLTAVVETNAAEVDASIGKKIDESLATDTKKDLLSDLNNTDAIKINKHEKPAAGEWAKLIDFGFDAGAGLGVVDTVVNSVGILLENLAVIAGKWLVNEGFDKLRQLLAGAEPFSVIPFGAILPDSSFTGLNDYRFREAWYTKMSKARDDLELRRIAIDQQKLQGSSAESNAKYTENTGVENEVKSDFGERGLKSSYYDGDPTDNSTIEVKQKLINLRADRTSLISGGKTVSGLITISEKGPKPVKDDLIVNLDRETIKKAYYDQVGVGENKDTVTSKLDELGAAKNTVANGGQSVGSRIVNKTKEKQNSLASDESTISTFNSVKNNSFVLETGLKFSYEKHIAGADLDDFDGLFNLPENSSKAYDRIKQAREKILDTGEGPADRGYLTTPNMMSTIRDFYINTLQRWRIKFDTSGHKSDSTLFDYMMDQNVNNLLTYYCMEFVLEEPEVTLGQFNFGKVYKDITSFKNKPFSVTFMVDNKMIIPYIFTRLKYTYTGYHQRGMVGWKEDFMIPAIYVFYEDQGNMDYVMAIKFHNCIMTNYFTMTANHENTEVQKFTCVFDYEEISLIGHLERNVMENIDADDFVSFYNKAELKTRIENGHLFEDALAPSVITTLHQKKN